MSVASRLRALEKRLAKIEPAAPVVVVFPAPGDPEPNGEHPPGTVERFGGTSDRRLTVTIEYGEGPTGNYPSREECLAWADYYQRKGQKALARKWRAYAWKPGTRIENQQTEALAANDER